ncbi:hypothetical protein DINM_003986 [Dirofilaria immitis]|nr:hypothetical protein [Dirofilaria immitis]
MEQKQEWLQDLTAVRCGLAMEKSRDCASKGIWTDIGTTEESELKVASILSASPSGNNFSEIHREEAGNDTIINTNSFISQARTLFDDNCVKKAFLQISSKRKDRDVASIYVSVMVKDESRRMQLREFYVNRDINVNHEQELIRTTIKSLGLLCPIIFPWKLVVQDSWKKGMSWDEKLKSEEMRAAWS